MLSLLPTNLPLPFGVSSMNFPKVRPLLATMNWLLIIGKLLASLPVVTMPSTTRSLPMPILHIFWITVILFFVAKLLLLFSELELKSSSLSVLSTKSNILQKSPLPVWFKLKLKVVPLCFPSTTMVKM